MPTVATRPDTTAGRRSPLAALPRLRADPLGFIAGLGAAGEPLTRVSIGFRRLWFVHDPDLVDDVLVRHREAFDRPAPMRRVLAEAAGGPSLFTETAGPWEHRRRLLGPAFSRREVESAVPGLTALVEDEIAGWGDPAGVPLGAAARRLALRVALRSCSDPSAPRWGTPTRWRCPSRGNAMATRRVFSLLPAPMWVPTPANRRQLANRAHLRGELRRLVAATPPAPAGSGCPVAGGLVAGLRATAVFTDEQLVSEAVGLLFAGHETTAAALVWTLVELAARADLWDGAGLGPDDEVAGRCVDEALRLHPPVWALLRRTDTTVRLAGQRVRRGDFVVIPLWALHRADRAAGDSRSVPDQATFAPERAGDAAAAPAAFLPFGRGARACIGAHLAVAELGLAVRAVTRRYTVAGLDPPSPGRSVGLVMWPAPEPRLYLRPRARDGDRNDGHRR